jgi:hypothetical protein
MLQAVQDCPAWPGKPVSSHVLRHMCTMMIEGFQEQWAEEVR